MDNNEAGATIAFTYADVRWMRDTIKEAVECDEIDDVRDELKQVQELLEDQLL